MAGKAGIGANMYGVAEKLNNQQAAKERDYTADVVPQSQRRGAASLALLWLTMSVIFPGIMAGFDWYRIGFSLQQVLACTVTSCLILTVYATAAAWLGAVTGQSWGLLVRRVFGSNGSKLLATSMVGIFVAFYSLYAALLAQGLNGMFHTPIPTIWLAAILAALMSLNNIFGFSGVVNFARFVVAPVLIVWVGLTAAKAITLSSPSVWTHTGNQSFPHAMTIITSYILGLGIWGDEPDFWRFSKPKVKSIVGSLSFAFIAGFFLFPVTGWLLANLTGITSYDAATNLVNSFAFGPMLGIAALIMTLNYFAGNDSNLYGAITTFESIVQLKRRKVVFLLTAVSALFSMWLTTKPDALEIIFAVNGVLMSAPTVIMVLELLVVNKLMHIKQDFSVVLQDNEVPAFNTIPCLALLGAYSIGILSSGVIPGTSALQVGICAVQAWLAGAIIYCCLRFFSYRNKKALLAQLEHQVIIKEQAFVE